jgi:3',5'-cyclic AMP phosphodiesterase CpdA
VRIVLLSDTHVAPRAHAFNANLRTCLEWIRTAQPDLVMHLGDITADAICDSVQLGLAATMLAQVEPPLYLLPGNHDIGDNPVAPGRPGEHPFDPLRLAGYRNILGADWWAVKRAGWQLIGLNALLFGTGHEEEERQFTWLAAQLVASSGPLGVLLHKPLFRDGPADREAHDRYAPWEVRERLLRLLETRDLRFVVSGHTHQARRLQVGSVEHIWLPSTSFCIPDVVQEPIGAKVVGVGVLELDEQAHRFELVTPPGLVRNNLFDHAAVYPAVAELRAKLGCAVDTL